jgi:hypothetical protein
MNYDFCPELDTPEICVILNQQWWMQNKIAIINWLVASGGCSGALNNLTLFIPKPADRTYFMLRWPQ